jgi:2-keto-3-deoxy-6-phosphogluconate aldolase
MTHRHIIAILRGITPEESVARLRRPWLTCRDHHDRGAAQFARGTATRIEDAANARSAVGHEIGAGTVLTPEDVEGRC